MEQEFSFLLSYFLIGRKHFLLSTAADNEHANICIYNLIVYSVPAQNAVGSGGTLPICSVSFLAMRQGSFLLDQGGINPRPKLPSKISEM